MMRTSPLLAITERPLNPPDAPTTAMHPIVFFDGVCGLCNGAVDFLLRIDHRGVLRFAPFQGETALAQLGEAVTQQLTTIVLVDAQGQHTQSDAVLRILVHVGGVWRLAALGRVVPRFVRDALYAWVARHRYGWFGVHETCRMPTPAERGRLLP